MAPVAFGGRAFATDSRQQNHGTKKALSDGGAAHLGGVLAAKTTLPILGVPIQSKALQGLDSLLSIVQMPGGVPVATLAIGKPGATNAALLAVSILALSRPGLRDQLHAFRAEQTEKVRQDQLP